MKQIEEIEKLKKLLENVNVDKFLYLCNNIINGRVNIQFYDELKKLNQQHQNLTLISVNINDQFKITNNIRLIDNLELHYDYSLCRELYIEKNNNSLNHLPRLTQPMLAWARYEQDKEAARKNINFELLLDQYIPNKSDLKHIILNLYINSVYTWIQFARYLHEDYEKKPIDYLKSNIVDNLKKILTHEYKYINNDFDYIFYIFENNDLEQKEHTDKFIKEYIKDRMFYFEEQKKAYENPIFKEIMDDEKEKIRQQNKQKIEFGIMYDKIFKKANEDYLNNTIDFTLLNDNSDESIIYNTIINEISNPKHNLIKKLNWQNDKYQYNI